MMRRREFITLLGGAAAAWPIVARAQQARARPVSAWCRSERVQSIQEGLFRPFLEQMGQLGYVDGQNIIYERRFAEGHDERIGGFIADLARRVVDIIVVTGTRESLAARQGTASIPIVTLVNPDPIGLGLAQSLARPGGNVTGLTSMDSAIYGKRIEILKQAVPDLKKAGMLVSPGKPDNQRGSPWARGVEADARSLGIELDIVQATTTIWMARSPHWPPMARGAWWSPQTASTRRTARPLPTARSGTACRACFRSVSKPKPAGCSSTRRATRTCRVAARSSLIASSRAPSLRTCRSSSRRNSSW
jgi:hypothetical protein